ILVLALLHALKEALKGQVYPLDHILEYLRGHFGQIRAGFFASRHFGTLIFVGEQNACHLIGTFAFIKRSIIHLTAPASVPTFALACASDRVGTDRFWSVSSLLVAFLA